MPETIGLKMSSLKLFKKYFLNHQPANGPVKQDDFDMYLEPVSLEEYKKALFAYKFDTKVLATIGYQSKPYEILQLDIPGDRSAKGLLIFAGVHGNEFAAALAVPDLLEEIQANPATYADWNIRIVTPLNPVGFVYQSRYNEIGRDINRDFKDFSTMGGKLQKEAIEQFKPDVLISLHEGPQDGFFVIAEGGTPTAWREHLTTSLKGEGIKLAQKSFFGMNIGEGYWQKNRFIYALQKLFGIYTLGRYAHEHGIILLTTESPWGGHDVEARKRPHVVVIRTVLKES